MSAIPTQRHFRSDRVAWTVRVQARPPAIRFRSAFHELRLLPFDPPELPSEDPLAGAPEAQLREWLARSTLELSL